ncbi:MAG: methyltransferase domain-containing protein [Planctomycetota bacterium]
MNELSPRLEQIFFEVFEALPRQGPGSRACAERALASCSGLPLDPAVLDLGCGTGGQTLVLAELTGGTIVAIDSHAPSIERLRAAVAGRGLSERVHPRVGDIARADLESSSFDLIWSEGALYNVGLEPALKVCHDLLRPGGFLVFTEPVWRDDDPAAEVRAMFADYPGMGNATDAIRLIERCGLRLVSHFTLPDSAWWDDFYTPMRGQIEALRRKYAGDPEAQAALDEIAREPEMHEKHSSTYGYELFIAQR